MYYDKYTYILEYSNQDINVDTLSFEGVILEGVYCKK